MKQKKHHHPKPLTPPQVPVKVSDSQPLSLGITLDKKSILRDVLEQKLPVDTIKKLR